MVPEGSHVKSVYLAPETGVLASTLGSKIIIDCSTIDTSTSLLIRDEISKQSPKALFYDAPVSGGSLGAAKGTLTFMLGCSASDPNHDLSQRITRHDGHLNLSLRRSLTRTHSQIMQQLLLRPHRDRHIRGIQHRDEIRDGSSSPCGYIQDKYGSELYQ